MIAGGSIFLVVDSELTSVNVRWGTHQKVVETVDCSIDGVVVEADTSPEKGAPLFAIFDKTFHQVRQIPHNINLRPHRLLFEAPNGMSFAIACAKVTFVVIETPHDAKNEKKNADENESVP